MIDTTSFQTALLAWFDVHGRKDLPWQHNKTPYRVWISEIMLQQTQVSTVIPYFLRFMERFPTVATLAVAAEDEVLHYWTGLGYYNRARNLHRAANLIMQQFAGKFPDQQLDLEMLPGIGRSTAGAILAIAFQKNAAILDGNVKRVLTRLDGITTWPGEKTTLAYLWQLSQTLTLAQRPADYTQAIMDLGATVCTRSKPRCHACPVQSLCAAHRLDIVKEVPRAQPKKTLPIRQATFLVMQQAQHILLEKRSGQGVWRHLWSVPELTGFVTEKKIADFCQQTLRYVIDNVYLATPIRHTFSHFHLDILPAIITLKKRPSKIMENTEQIWYDPKNPAKIGLPAPVKLLLENICA